MTQYQMDNSTVRPERIVLLAVDLTDFAGNRVVRQNDFQAAVAEAKELIRATGGELVETVTCQKDRPSPALFIGSGKTEEIAELIETLADAEHREREHHARHVVHALQQHAADDQ